MLATAIAKLDGESLVEMVTTNTLMLSTEFAAANIISAFD